MKVSIIFCQDLATILLDLDLILIEYALSFLLMLYFCIFCADTEPSVSRVPMPIFEHDLETDLETS